MLEKFKQKLKERKLRGNQKLKERCLKRKKKEREILINSLKNVLSYEEYTEVIFVKGTFKSEGLKRYAKLTNDGNDGEVYIITKDSSETIVARSYMDIEIFCEDYSIKDTYL